MCLACIPDFYRKILCKMWHREMKLKQKPEALITGENRNQSLGLLRCWHLWNGLLEKRNLCREGVLEICIRFQLSIWQILICAHGKTLQDLVENSCWMAVSWKKIFFSEITQYWETLVFLLSIEKHFWTYQTFSRFHWMAIQFGRKVKP